MIALSDLDRAVTPTLSTIAFRQVSISLKSASDNLNRHTYGTVMSRDSILSCSDLVIYTKKYSGLPFTCYFFKKNSPYFYLKFGPISLLQQQKLFLWQLQRLYLFFQSILGSYYSIFKYLTSSFLHSICKSFSNTPSSALLRFWL